MNLHQSLKEWWEKQKEAGRALDAKFAPPRKPDYLCLYPGCMKFGQWVYLSDSSELKTPELEMPAFFSRKNWVLVGRQFLFFLRHPILSLKADKENDDIRNAVVMLACDEHRRERCPWTRVFVEKKCLNLKENEQ